jgi:hypothetical protein
VADEFGRRFGPAARAKVIAGGVFKADPLKERVLTVLNRWLKADGGQPVRELEGAEYDLAVARGAAYYGWVRQGHGLRIRGGTARARQGHGRGSIAKS